MKTKDKTSLHRKFLSQFIVIPVIILYFYAIGTFILQREMAFSLYDVVFILLLYYMGSSILFWFDIRDYER